MSSEHSAKLCIFLIDICAPLPTHARVIALASACLGTPGFVGKEKGAAQPGKPARPGKKLPPYLPVPAPPWPWQIGRCIWACRKFELQVQRPSCQGQGVAEGPDAGSFTDQEGPKPLDDSAETSAPSGNTFSSKVEKRPALLFTIAHNSNLCYSEKYFPDQLET